MNRTPGQIGGAAVAGALIGAGGGAALADSVPGADVVLWAIVGALALGVISAVADATRRPGTPQPLVARVAAAAFLAAMVGWLLQFVLPDWPAWSIGAFIGGATGLAGLRPSKLALGLAIGVGVGLAFEAWAPDVGWAVVAAVTVVVYRMLAAALWRGKEQVRVVGERATAESLPFVVPFTEAGSAVGVDYLERYALSVGSRFTHSPADIGIIGDFSDLAGPGLDVSSVHPVVKEFYEHTSRFTLSIVPEWKRWMRLPYRIYRATVAKPLGQANAPFEIEEVQRGVMSWIDTLDVDGDGIVDVRAWIRAYEDGQPIYVGIYTVAVIDGTPFVAVGFPVPSGNFTATLQPFNDTGSGLLLKSDGDAGPAGHYLSFIDGEGELTTLKLESFGEEIHVFMKGEELKTEHRFTLGGVTFLTLHYEIARKPADA